MMSNSKSAMWRRLGLGLFAALLGGITPMAVQGEGEEATRRTITVTGTATASVVPDEVLVQVGVTTEGATAGEALAKNTESMTKLFEVIKAQGVEQKDVQTSQIQISPRYSQPAPRQQGEFTPRINGYQVSNMVAIRVRAVSKLGGMLDALIEAGSNSVNGIQFRVSDAEQRIEGLRILAVRDAAARARALAEAAGMRLGLPIQILDSGAVGPQSEGFVAMGGYMAKMDRGSAPVPVAQGERELRASIRIIYELLPRE